MKNAYLKDGRLSDVLALIQVLAFDRDTYRSETGLYDEFQRNPVTGVNWMEISKEHPEFFRVRNSNEKEPRVALLARYVLPKQEQLEGDQKKPPLQADIVNKLLELAVDLHDKQSERESRWRTLTVPLIVSLVSAFASVGAALIGLSKQNDGSLSNATTQLTSPPASNTSSNSPQK